MSIARCENLKDLDHRVTNTVLEGRRSSANEVGIKPETRGRLGLIGPHLPAE